MNASEKLPDAQKMRLFYALWPDDATRAALAKWRRFLKGRPVPVHNLHITLAFLGDQPAQLLPNLCSVLNRLEAPPMMLKMDRLGHFAKSRVAWAGMSMIPNELLELHDALRHELLQMSIRFDDRPKFVPHLTLVRNAMRPEMMTFEPIEWLADHVALVHSPMDGSPYRLLASRKLTRS